MSHIKSLFTDMMVALYISSPFDVSVTFSSVTACVFVHSLFLVVLVREVISR